jgi:hypothetical protein
MDHIDRDLIALLQQDATQSYVTLGQAVGLSTGADILIQVAGQGTDLKAVVADGTYAGSFEDTQRIMGVTAITPFAALEFATVGVTSGTTPGPVIEDMMKRITSPLLLVAAGPLEKDAGELYDRAAGAPGVGRGGGTATPRDETQHGDLLDASAIQPDLRQLRKHLSGKMPDRAHITERLHGRM